MADGNVYMIGESPFILNGNYKLIKPLGQGAYGLVCECVDVRSGRHVAVKKISRIVDHITDSKRCLRELRLLRALRHENIIRLIEVLPPLGSLADFRDLYVVTELMETDLHQVIQAQELTVDYVSYFAYQLLRGLKFMHSANIIHRDLKPANLLVNSNCDLKICDLGLARVAGPEESQAGFMTEYVATRWYRAPEVMLSWAEYSCALDMWAVGCIFAEMLQRRPLFPGRDFLNQLQLIVNFLGSPSDEDIAAIKSERARKYMLSLPRRAPVDLSRAFPTATPVALDFLSGLLVFNPARRMTVEQALAHPFMADIHDPSDEPLCYERFDFTFERMALTPAIIRRMLIEEALSYHPHGPEVLAQLDAYHASEARGQDPDTDDTEEAGPAAMDM